MNTANIKSYAPKARRDFIQAVTEKAHLLGLSEDHIEPVEIKGDVVIITGRPYPKKVGAIRQELEDRINRDGFELTMRSMAYTWFNRFVAIRYMELHDYLDHGFRVLSNRSGSEIPEILEHATDVKLPSLNKEEIISLRLAGDKDNELYQLLIVAQCNALSQAMPFLFEKIGGYAELLMPDNLLHSNSPVRNLVNEIPEEDWQQIEIIGWIYQFYISEKKEEVIGKVVKSEDIPAATQLFTPNWIVKYMVQNSLGAKWLATYPQSKLKEQMEYYIEPAEQTDEVKAQLAAITPSALNPEELTLIDPACGSGHILVEAYDLFKAIYLERGYRQRDIAQMILEKNLFGLDIDGRAAQLAGFALMMKGRADDRRFFEWRVQLNVMALVDSTDFDADGIVKGMELSIYELAPSDLLDLKRLFGHATTFGSLIQVPAGLVEKISAFKQLSNATSNDLFVSAEFKRLGPLMRQVQILAAQYDVVVANPPYLGAKSFPTLLKSWLNAEYRGYDTDLFSTFIVRLLTFTKIGGHSGMMTSFAWMFITSFERLRRMIFADHTITSLVQLHYDAFTDAKAHVCAFVVQNKRIDQHKSSFVRLTDFPGVDKQGPKTIEAIRNRNCGWFFETIVDDFDKIPGIPVAYWVSSQVRKVFETFESLGKVIDTRKGLATSNNELFLRRWWEVSRCNTSMGCTTRESAAKSSNKWFPLQKGGPFRKWYGNHEFIINWKDDGYDIRHFFDDAGKLRSRPQNLEYSFKQAITWSKITSGSFSARYCSHGFLFDDAGAIGHHPDSNLLMGLLPVMTSKVGDYFFNIINSTVNLQIGDVGRLPVAPICFSNPSPSGEYTNRCIRLTEADWNTYERSWDFKSLHILTASTDSMHTLESSYKAWITENRQSISEMKRLEEENNRLYIDAYGLADELTPDVFIEQITLTVNPTYRYGGKLSEEEQWNRFRLDTMQELVSYAIGCMMGRYSLDKPGLIYAHSGNVGFDPSRYSTFPADDDGIIPLTDTEWFNDDACNRLVEFISLAWDAEYLETNLTFLAGNLSPKKNESSRETLRRYLCDSFFKNHLQTYKNRPIYWLLSSGKLKAFQSLFYLHRYNESTLSRVRSAYVTPLFGNFNGRLEYLQNEWEAADTASAKKKFQKEIDDMKKKLAELSTFDDELRHYADKRISLDLDDGVKVNYGKFGNLLAEKKTVTGS